MASMKWELKRFDENDMPEDLDNDIREGLRKTFPEDDAYFAKQRGWKSSMPEYSIVAQGDDRLVGHAGVVKRDILAGNETLTAGGIQNVFVIPEMKGSGLSGDLIRAATAEMARRGYDCGLLFCLPALEKVYAPMGWQHIAGRSIFIRQDGQRIPLVSDNIAMFFPLKTFTLPQGEIDLQGEDW